MSSGYPPEQYPPPGGYTGQYPPAGQYPPPGYAPQQPGYPADTSGYPAAGGYNQPAYPPPPPQGYISSGYQPVPISDSTAPAGMYGWDIPGVVPATPATNTIAYYGGTTTGGSAPPPPSYAAATDPEANKWDDGGAFAGNSFSDKAIRHAFIKKVYLILFTQLSVTVAFIAFFLFYHPARDWVKANSWFYYVSYATFLVTYITLVCCPGVRRKYPGNFICLGVFTLAFSYMTATISSFYDTGIVLIAAGITCAVCLAITIFAIQTKIDFTLCSGLLFALVMVLIFFGFACMITYLISGFNYIMHCVYGGLAALVFSLFLAYDTQMLVGGRKHELSSEEYIYGALQLYIDVVYIFLIILSFFGGKSN